MNIHLFPSAQTPCSLQLSSWITLAPTAEPQRKKSIPGHFTTRDIPYFILLLQLKNSSTSCLNCCKAGLWI